MPGSTPESENLATVFAQGGDDWKGQKEKRDALGGAA